MQPTLACQAKKSRLLFTHAGFDWAAGMRIAYRLIPLIPERMVRQFVLTEVTMDISITPVNQWVYFETTLLLA